MRRISDGLRYASLRIRLNTQETQALKPTANCML